MLGGDQPGSLSFQGVGIFVSTKTYQNLLSPRFVTVAILTPRFLRL
jgi:hypothetical protein